MNKFLFFIIITLTFSIFTFAQPNREGKVDDGFTWFETMPTFSLDSTQSRVNTGWSLRSTIRLIGEYVDGSQIKIDVVKGGKILQTNTCKGGSFHKPANYKPDSFMWTVACWNKSQTTLETGLFDVKVYSIVQESLAENDNDDLFFELNRELKGKLLSILAEDCIFDGRKQPLLVAVGLYAASVKQFITGEGKNLLIPTL